MRLHQSHEHVVVVDTVKLATVPLHTFTLKTESFIQSDRDRIGRKDLKLNTLDTAPVRRSDGLFGESAAIAGAAIGRKKAHAEAADVLESFELRSDDVAPSDHFIGVGNGNKLETAAREKAAYKRCALLDGRPDYEAQVAALARDCVDRGMEACDM